MELAAIINRYQDRFNKQYAVSISNQQHHALQSIAACHTERYEVNCEAREGALGYGEMKLHCSECNSQLSRFHSCGNRCCPRCQNHDTTRWLERQSQKLLPVEYFMVTFTLPAELRTLVRQHQKQCYSLLFDCAISTLKDFGINDKKLGAALAMTAVLHTHSRRLDYHPHLHIIVPGGCINKKRKQWKKLRGKYLFNEFALATVFRARILAGLDDLSLSLPDSIPTKWVVDCRHVGKGLPALKYLSRYLYRGVISEKNIIEDDGTFVTFRYLEGQTKTWKTRKVTGQHFLFLVSQHALPKGFRRVRDFGFLHGNAKKTLTLIQLILNVILPSPVAKPRPHFCCSVCGAAMTIVAFIPPSWRVRLSL